MENQKEVVDIFEQLEKPNKQEKSPIIKEEQQQAPIVIEDSNEKSIDEIKKINFGKVVLVIGIIIFILTGIFIVLTLLKKTVAEPIEDLPVIEISEDLKKQPEEVINKDEELVAENISKEDMDIDGDGLTDEEEDVHGTHILKVDSDEDGLNDFEEIRVYKTDPLNPDTDGDGYLDGDEVFNNYDPNGAGRLLDFEKAFDEYKQN